MGDASVFCIHCGVELLPETKDNPSFTTPDDWELVRVKVVLPNMDVFETIIYDNGIGWWLLKTPEETSQTVADIVKSRPDLFPWVEMME
jgi:hypothetical protein